RSVLVFALLLVVVVGLLFGLGTALRARQTEPYSTLKEAGRGADQGGKAKLQSALVVAQVFFAFVLLVGAGLIMQAFLRLVPAYQGFQAANVLRAEVRLPQKSYSDHERVAEFYERLLKGIVGLPGASAAAIITNSPASNVDNETTFFTIRGRTVLQAADAPAAELQITSPGYFSVLRIPLLSGRLLLDSDRLSTARVAVISHSMAS